ncbi:hypothetical protein AWENTII_011334 [Aspergillus wentii]
MTHKKAQRDVHGDVYYLHRRYESKRDSIIVDETMHDWMQIEYSSRRRVEERKRRGEGGFIRGWNGEVTVASFTTASDVFCIPLLFPFTVTSHLPSSLPSVSFSSSFIHSTAHCLESNAKLYYESTIIIQI